MYFFMSSIDLEILKDYSFRFNSTMISHAIINDCYVTIEECNNNIEHLIIMENGDKICYKPIVQDVKKI